MKSTLIGLKTNLLPLQNVLLHLRSPAELSAPQAEIPRSGGAAGAAAVAGFPQAQQTPAQGQQGEFVI